MTWRLICDKCTRKLGEEIKSIGILQNPDIRCAGCGVFIRKNDKDLDGSGKKWFPVSEEQLLRACTMNEVVPDAELHCGFALDDDERDLGKAQDEICLAVQVRCTVFKCDEVDLGVHVVQIYMNDHTPNPIFAGTVWRHDRWPSLIEIIFALRAWRGPDAPDFLAQWYKEEEEGVVPKNEGT